MTDSILEPRVNYVPDIHILTLKGKGVLVPTFIMHSKFSTDPIRSTESEKELEKQTVDQIHSKFPQVKWTNLVVIGPHEYIETFCAPNPDTALEIVSIMRSFGKAHIEVWPVS